MAKSTTKKITTRKRTSAKKKEVEVIKDNVDVVADLVEEKQEEEVITPQIEEVTEEVAETIAEVENDDTVVEATESVENTDDKPKNKVFDRVYDNKEKLVFKGPNNKTRRYITNTNDYCETIWNGIEYGY